MAKFNNILIDVVLERAGIYSAAEKAVRRFASSGEVNERVSEIAEELNRGFPWSSSDAEKLLHYSGKELWGILTPTQTGAWVEMRGIVPARLTQERGEGTVGVPREHLTDLRGKERYG